MMGKEEGKRDADLERVRKLLAERGKRGLDPIYYQRFIEEFRERQRREVLMVETGTLLRERFQTWFHTALPDRSHLLRRAWMVGGFLVALLLVSRILNPQPGAERSAAGVFEAGNPSWNRAPSRVEIAWEGRDGDSRGSGYQVSEEMFVSVEPEAALQDRVEILAAQGPSRARVVLLDERSGLVFLSSATSSKVE